MGINLFNVAWYQTDYNSQRAWYISPIYILTLLEMIKNVLQTNSSSFQKGFFSDIVKPLMGDGLLTSEGEMWKLHHKLANSGFQVNSLSTPP